MQGDFHTIIGNDTGIMASAGMLPRQIGNKRTIVIVEVGLIVQATNEHLVGSLFRLLSQVSRWIHHFTSVTVLIEATEAQFQFLVVFWQDK